MSFWEDLLKETLPELFSAGVTSAGSYLTSAGSGATTDRQLQNKQAFEAQQNQLQRDAAMEQLKLSLAAQAANAGGGNAAAMAAVKQRAYEAAINAFLQGGANLHDSATSLTAGIQAPYAGNNK